MAAVIWHSVKISLAICI